MLLSLVLYCRRLIIKTVLPPFYYLDEITIKVFLKEIILSWDNLWYDGSIRNAIKRLIM
jgi:hypothetical protein